MPEDDSKIETIVNAAMEGLPKGQVFGKIKPDDVKKVIRTYIQEEVRLSVELESSQTKVSELQTEKSELTTKLGDSEQKLTELTSQTEIYSKQVSEHKTQTAELQTEKSELTTKLQSTETKTAELVKEATSYKTEIAGLVDDISGYRGEVSALQRYLSDTLQEQALSENELAKLVPEDVLRGYAHAKKVEKDKAEKDKAELEALDEYRKGYDDVYLVEIGTVANYYRELGVAKITLTQPLNQGDRIHIQGQKTSLEQNVDSMELDHKSITEAAAGADIGVKVKHRVSKDSTVYKMV